MNQQEKRNVKKTGHYRSPDDINKLKIRVLIKEIRSTIPIKSEDSDESEEFETRLISWQEKVLSRSEIEFYGNEKNCITDVEKGYHKDISKLQDFENILFSCVEDDERSKNIRPLDNCVGEGNQNVGYLCKKINELRIRNKNMDCAEKTSGYKHRQYDFKNSLESCLTNPFVVDDNEYMYIMADLGEKIDSIWLKAEHTLCTIKFDSKRKLLQIYPDFSLSQEQPYVIEIKRDRRCVYNYYIFNASDNIPEEIYKNEFEILSKINQQQSKPKLPIAESGFEMAPKNKLKVHVFLEILNGFGFEYDNIFVHYFIELPPNWSCDNEADLQGVTQTCKTKGWKHVAHFGQPCEITLTYNVQDLEATGVPSVPFLYLEVVSRDSWDRYRTEGLTYKSLPISAPGEHVARLQCLRVLPQSVFGNLRRFFIGDYHTLGDITWIGVPTDYKNSTINKYGVDTMGTGTLNLRFNVVQQSQAFLKSTETIGDQEKFIWERLNAATLVKSVHQVLAAFKRARKNIKQARKNI